MIKLLIPKKIILTILSLQIILVACNEDYNAEKSHLEYIEAVKADSANRIVRLKNDSIEKVKKENLELKRIAELKEYHKTPAGKILKKHPSWTKEDCERLANKEIWIGMSIKMVSFLRGLPDSKNVSNYGKGNEYQYCWTNYEISCFYTREDQIVYAYN
jgi:hypothetical protein